MDDISRQSIALGFWDRKKSINDQFVYKRVKQLSLFYKNSASPNTPFYTETNIDRLLKALSLTNHKYALIQSFGHTTMRRSFFDSLFQEIQGKDFFVMGHILDHKDNFYELHHQCFLINLQYYREYNHPSFGSTADTNVLVCSSQRSDENFHDDYTPYWIKYKEGEKNIVSHPKEGWNLINTSLKNQKTVYNFSSKTRSLKNYLYPHATTEVFHKCLKNPDLIYKQEDINPCQKHFLEGMAYNWEAGRKSIFIFNTERLCDNHNKTRENEKLDALFCVAAGFKGLKILKDCGYHRETEIIYFDFAQNALDFKKRLQKKWNGLNYVNYLKSLVSEYKYGHYQAIPKNEIISAKGDPRYADLPLEEADWDKHELLWKQTQDDFGGENIFFKTWITTASLKHTYLNEDIMSLSSVMIEKLASFEGKNVGIFWSNSFSVETAFCYMDKGIIDQGFKNFLFVLKNLRCNFYLYGTTPEGIDLQHFPNNYFKDVL